MLQSTFMPYLSPVGKVYADNPDFMNINITILTPDYTAPAAISDLVATPGPVEGSITINWTAPGDDGTVGNASYYQMRYATTPINNLTDWDNPWNVVYPTFAASGSGTLETEIVGGLTPGVTYYFAIRAVDDYGHIATWDGSANPNNYCAAQNNIPAAPSGVNLVASSATINISWTANPEPDIHHYNIYRSSVTNTNYLLLTAILHPNTTHQDTGLTNGVTYWYKLSAVDNTGQESGYSIEKSTVPYAVTEQLPPVVGKEPKQPVGIKALIQYVNDQKQIKLSWDAVKEYVDGTPVGNIYYRIYRSSDVNSGYVVISTTTASEFVDWSGNNFYYYYVTAVEATKESQPSMTATTSGEIYAILKIAGRTKVAVYLPAEASGVLYKDNNKYGQDLLIKIQEASGEKTVDDLGVYDILVYSYDSNTAELNTLPGLEFVKPIKIMLYYEVENNYVKNTSVAADEADKRLAAFYYNNVEWIKLGGLVDKVARCVSVETQHLSRYALRVTLRGNVFTRNNIEPDKIFTPNGDGIYDTLNIYYDNPQFANITLNIYNIKGQLIRSQDFGSSSSGVLRWDGKDSDNKAVPAGVYIYQIQLSGNETRVINGTCVVAK